jgi:hypothetical protein
MENITELDRPLPLDNFRGMPQASLAQLMREVGRNQMRKRWKRFVREKHFASIERDCRVVSRLELGRFAWLVGISGSYLVQIGHVHWGRDRFGNSLKIQTSPPVCLDGDRELGLRFLINVAGSNYCQTGTYFFINTLEQKDNRVTEASSYELAGLAMVHNEWETYGLFGKEEICRKIWTQMDPE